MWEQGSYNPSDFTLSSFSYDLAYFLKEHSENISSQTDSYATAIIINKEDNLDQRKDFDNVAIKYTLITDSKISLDELLAEGKDVTLWTENTVGTLRLIIKYVGDNWIYVTFVTNFPDTLAWEADRQYQKMIEEENENNTYATRSSEYPINNEPYIETSSNTSYRNSCKNPYKISDIRKPNYSMERYKTNHPKIMQNKPIRKQYR